MSDFDSGQENRRRSPCLSGLAFTVISIVFYASVIMCTVSAIHFYYLRESACETEACKISAIIRANMNTSVNPCDNFYEYACGNFKKHHSIPDDEAAYSYTKMMSHEVQKLVNAELSKPPPANETKALKWARDFYQNCRREEEREDEKFLQELVEKVLGHEMITEQLIVKALRKGVPSFFSISTVDDPSDAKKQILFLDQPKFTVAKRDLSNKTDPEAKRIRLAYEQFIRAGLKLFNPNMTDVSSDILKIEMNLAKIAAKDEDRRDLSVIKRVSVRELASRIKSIDMKKILKTFSRTKTDELLVGDMKYFEQLDQKLRKINSRDYHVWKVIEKNGRSSNFTDAQFMFEKVRTGIKRKPSRKSFCFKQLMERAPFIVGRVYVDAKNITQKDKNEAEKMFNQVRQSMEKIINGTDWMDDKTKELAVHKLRKMTVNVGYPEWIKNDTLLSETIPDQNSTEYRPSNSLLRRQQFIASDGKLDQRTIHPHQKWRISPAQVNAIHVFEQNSITIPAAILRSVFYEPSRPDYLNYGGIGFVIGHEITHGFDDQGAQFDAEGKLVNRWNNSTLKSNNHMQHIVKEYSDIFDKTSGLHLNGENTEGENIADFGGIRAAYAAVFDSKKQYQPLVGMEFFSPQKLFFLSHANAWCSVIRPEKLRQLIISNEHPPSEYRVNIPLKNFDKFSEAFSCQTKSPMNPDKKIRLW